MYHIDYTTGGSSDTQVQEQHYNAPFTGNYGELPDWFRKIGNFQNACTHMDIDTICWQPGHTDITGSRSPWTFRLTTVSNKYNRYGTYLVGNQTSPTITEPTEAIANNDALTKLQPRLRDEITAFQGGVFLGELRETLHLIRHPLKGLFGGLRSYLRTVKKRARKQAHRHRKRVIEDTWLEYTFGWAPLVADIDDASQYLEKLLANQHPPVKILTVRGKHETSAVKGNLSHWNLGKYFKSGYIRTRKKSFEVKYQVCLRIDPVGKYKHRDLGISWMEFAPTVWELIPYSFLVDYFTNMGNVIQAYTFPWGRVKWKNKWVIYKEEIIHSPYLIPLTSAEKTLNYRNRFMNASVPGKRIHRTITRDQYLGDLLPDFRFELPGLSMRWLNVAALAAARL
jgi:hypothetical protein